MGDIGPGELMEGRLIPMGPAKLKHGRIESRFDRILGMFVDEQGLSEVQAGQVGIYVC